MKVDIMTIEVNKGSYFYSLLKAHAAQEQGEAPSKYAYYGTPISLLRENITEYIYYGGREKVNDKIRATISNIAYSIQLLEFYINAKNELYLSFPIEKMLNKEILITSFEIQQSLISIMFEGYYKAQAKLKIGKLRKEERFDKEFIDALENERLERNRVHLNAKEQDCVPDYSAFDDVGQVNESINLLNQLLAKRLKDEEKLVLPNIE